MLHLSALAFEAVKKTTLNKFNPPSMASLEFDDEFLCQPYPRPPEGTWIHLVFSLFMKLFNSLVRGSDTRVSISIWHLVTSRRPFDHAESIYGHVGLRLS
jgi:hypothetical protein